MSEQEQERPLTRRELRERAEAAERAASAEAAAGSTEPAQEVEEAARAAEEDARRQALELQVQIDPLNEDGTPRTRREIRELREAAIAALLAEQKAEDASAEAEPADGDDVESESESESEGDTGADDGDDADASADTAAEDENQFRDESEPEAKSGSEQEAESEPEDEQRLDSEPEPKDEELSDEQSDEPAEESADLEVVFAEEDDFGPPTQAFSLHDLLDAAEPLESSSDTDAVAALFADDEHDEAEIAAVVDADLADNAVNEDAVIEAEIVDEQSADSDADETSEDSLDGDSQSEPVEAVVAVVPEPVGDEAAAAEDKAADADDSMESEPDAAQSEAEAVEDAPLQLRTDTSVYSFPDIQPPEESRSVFDNPERAAAVVAPGSSGDFDDLISRAVAAEGSTEGSGDSALILPTHPGDTGGLTGPLGATGELFITGSIELPKSLGETGGHAAYQDSVGLDAFLTGDTGEVPADSEDAGPGPVPARRAVSARRRPEVPVIAEPTKDKSKLPLILALSGGGLIILLAGTVIYAATQGLFG